MFGCFPLYLRVLRYILYVSAYIMLFIILFIMSPELHRSILSTSPTKSQLTQSVHTINSCGIYIGACSGLVNPRMAPRAKRNNRILHFIRGSRVSLYPSRSLFPLFRPMLCTDGEQSRRHAATVQLASYQRQRWDQHRYVVYSVS